MQLQDLSYDLKNDHILIKDDNIGEYSLSIEVFSLENVYTVNGYSKKEGKYVSEKILWGTDVPTDGEASLEIENTEKGKMFHACARLDKKVRGIKLRFDGLPLGKLLSSFSGEKQITDYGTLLYYPEGWRELSTPLLVFELQDKKYLYIRCFDGMVRAKRFFIKRENEKMRVDVCMDQDGVLIEDRFEAPSLECGICDNLEKIYTEQSEYIRNAYALEEYETSKIAPAWLKEISLVVTMHMEAFTGHIFHTYEKALADMQKIVKHIDGRKVLVYLAGWEGRYYYKYGDYTCDERLGGEEKLKALVDGLHKLGCKVMAMYGMNIANKNVPALKEIVSKAEFQSVSGARYHSGSVNWEGAHHYDFNELVQLNVGCPEWNDYLYGQILDATVKYGFDGAFLDIAACYTNDKNYNHFEGVERLCERLRGIKEDFLVAGEGFYDALAKTMPLFQSGHTNGQMHYHDSVSPLLFTRFVREFAHLCLGAPGSGSTGVHEQGINTETQTPTRKGILPTLSLVEDTVEKHFDEVMPIIEQANAYYGRYVDENDEKTAQ